MEFLCTLDVTTTRCVLAAASLSTLSDLRIVAFIAGKAAS